MDWGALGNQLLDILLPLLATFLTGVFTYIGTRLKKVYEEKVNTETAKAVVEDAVRFVEQVYKDLKGPEKLEKTTAQVAEILQSKGITITEAEINMLIESTIYGLNKGWFQPAKTIVIEDNNQQTIADTKKENNQVEQSDDIVVKASEITE